MSLAAIKAAAFDRLEATANLFPLYFDNAEDDRLPQPPTGDHLRPFVLPATTRTLGLIDLGQEVGLIQVSVYVQKGKGDIVAADQAALILAAFPRNLNLTVMRVDAFGSIAVPFYDGGWQITPVTIPYQHMIEG